jgi:hypothetical protein
LDGGLPLLALASIEGKPVRSRQDQSQRHEKLSFSLHEVTVAKN